MSDSESSGKEIVKKENKSSDSESSSEEEMKKEDRKEEKKSGDSSSSSEEESKEIKETSTKKKELPSSSDEEIKGDNKKENKKSSSSGEDSIIKNSEGKEKSNESSPSQENAQKKDESNSESEETQSQKSGENKKSSSEAEESEKENKKESTKEEKEARSRVDSVSPMISEEQPRNPNAWAESPAGLSKRQVGLVMVGLMLGLFLASLDQTIVSTALPEIVSEFGRLDLYSWVIIAYLLTSTITIPIAGKLSDVFGRKVCFMAVIIIFECASIVCGASPDMITLIVFRAIQGIGGGGIISLVQIVIGDIVSIRQRGKFGGLFGVVWAGSSVLGPILGGVITDNATWRWIFYINIPVGILSIVFVFFVLRIPGDSVKLRRELFQRIDYLGAIIFMSGIVLLLLAINFGGNQYPWDSVAVILCFILGGLIVVSFFFVEWKVPVDPLIPLKVMVQRNVGVSNLVAFGFGWAMFGSISYFPEYFQVVHGDTPTTSGLKLIALMFGIVGASMSSGMLITKTGHYYPWPIIGGMLLLTGLGLVGGLLTPSINLYLLSFFIFIIGLGIGSVIQTLVIIVQFSVDRKNMAVGTAAIAFMRTMGGVVGVAVCGAVLTNQLNNQISPQEVAIVNGGYAAIIQLPLDQQTAILNAYSNSLQYVFLSCIPAVGLATLLSFAIKREKIKKSEGAAPPVIADA